MTTRASTTSSFVWLGGELIGMSAVSSLKRDAANEVRSQCREDFLRGMEVEDFARTVVE